MLGESSYKEALKRPAEGRATYDSMSKEKLREGVGFKETRRIPALKEIKRRSPRLPKMRRI